MGFLPSTADFTPGTLTLRLQNTSGSVITGLNFGYEVWVRNDQDRGNTLNSSYSADGSSYTGLSLDFTSPAAKDTSPVWAMTGKTTSISGLTWANNSLFYLRWSSNDLSGSNSRDKLGLDDISFSNFITGGPPPAGQRFYFDVNNTAGGSGVLPSSSHLWSGNNWSDSSTGDSTNATSTFDSGNIATFAAGTDATGSTTINVDTAVSASGLSFEEGSFTIANSGGSLTLTGSATATVASSLTATISQAISGSAGFAKAGAGTLNLSGGNLYTGATAVNDGELGVSGGDAIPNGSAVTLANVAGAVLKLNAGETIASLAGGGATGGNINLQGNTLTLTGASNTSFAGVISGTSGSLVKNGSSNQTLTGNNNYTGLTDVQEGTLTLDRSGGAIADTAPVQVSGGTLAVSQSDTVGAVTLASGTISGAGTLTGASYAVLSGTISAALGGGAALTKTTAGSVTLSGSNTYTGLTDVQAGTLTLNRAGGTIADSAAVQVSGGELAVAQSDTVGAVTLTSGTISGAGTLTGSSYALHSGTVSAPLGGAAALTKSTAGMVTLSGANTFSGATNISDGTLALSGGGLLSASSGVNMTGGTFDITGISAGSATIASLAGTAGAVVNLGTKSLTVGDGSLATFAGTLQSTTGGLTKVGAGTFNLTQPNSGYAGTTTISEGAVKVSANTALGTGSVSIAGGSLYADAGNTIANALVIGSTENAFTFGWNFGTPSTGTASYSTSSGGGLTASDVSRGNNNNTPSMPALINDLADSSGYTGASGDWNAGAAAYIGVFNATSSTYFEFTLTPDIPTFQSSLNSLSFGARSTGTGPKAISIRSSKDSYASELLPESAASDSVWSLKGGASFPDTVFTEATTFRIYGYAGTGAASPGTANWRIDDLSLAGKTTTGGGTGKVGMDVPGAATFSGSVSMLGASTFSTVGGAEMTLSGPLSGGGAATKTGAGSLVLSGTSTHTGAFNIQQGAVTTTGGGIGDLSAVILSNTAGAQLVLTGHEDIGSLEGGGASGGNVDLGGNELTVGYLVSTPTTYAGVISGVGGSLTKRGAGTLTLTGTHSFSGSVSVKDNGTLSVPTTASLGAGTGNISLEGSGDGATLAITGADDYTLPPTRGLALSGTGGILEITAGTVNMAGGITSVSNLAHFTKTGAGILNYSGSAPWSANFNISGGTFNLDGGAIAGVGITNLTYPGSGPATTLKISTTGSMQTASIDIATNTAVILEAGTLRVGGGGLVSGRSIDNSGGTFTWGNGTLSVFTPSGGGESGNTDRSFGSSGPVVREGNYLSVNGSMTMASGSTLDLGSTYLSNGLRYNQFNVNGTLALSDGTLNIGLNPYFLRPSSPNSITTGDWGTLVLVYADDITGEFARSGGKTVIPGIRQDQIGWTQLADFSSTSPQNPFNPQSLALNTFLIEYRDGYGGLTQAGGDVILLHYKVAGSVPEPASAGLLLVGAIFLRARRRRRLHLNSGM